MVLLTSTKTQIPLDYYHAPYCRPSKITKEAENLGEVGSNFQIPRPCTNGAEYVAVKQAVVHAASARLLSVVLSHLQQSSRELRILWSL